MSKPHRHPRHDQYFLPGYSLHEVVDMHPTFDGKENLDGYTEEILMDKIKFIDRCCWKVGELVINVNDQLYDMQNERDVGLAWHILKAVYGICMKICRKNTKYEPNVQDACELKNTLECVNKIKLMLEHIKFASLHNPCENIKATTLDMWVRLFNKCSSTMEKHIIYVELKKENEMK